MIRVGTNWLHPWPFALSKGNEDAMLTIRDLDTLKLKKTRQIFKKVREELGNYCWITRKSARFTGNFNQRSTAARRILIP